jgi:UDP-glucuronate 4-epimerase
VKYLVTGAAGFVGSHLANQLVMNGHDVVAIDNYSDYYAPDLKRMRASTFLAPNGIQILEVSLEKDNEVRELLYRNNFHSVFHLAAQPGVRIPIGQQGRYISSNLTAFANLLTISRECKVANFLYASSSSVYGNCPDKSFSEISSIPSPVSFYGGSKLANEVMAKSGEHDSVTRTRAMRFFTVYGKWGRPDMAYFRLIASALDGYRFSMFGNGDVLRDFTFIDDVTKSIIKLDENLQTQVQGFGDVVNIGGGNPFSMNQMISTIEDILNVQVNAKLEATNSNDVSRTCANPEYLTSLIGSSPQTSLRAGLESVIKWSQQKEIIINLKRWSDSVY